MLRSLTLLVVFTGSLLLHCGSVSAGDFVPLEPNRRRPTPEELFQLEEALLAEPQRVETWIELIRALEADGVSWFLLRCYTDAAIRANPQARELRWERLRLLPTPAALDEFERLETIEPNRLLVEDHRSVLQLGLRPPRSWQDSLFYANWVGALLRRRDWQAAGEVSARGLVFNPSSDLLNTCYAMALIGQEKYPAAMEVIEKNSYRQSIGSLQHPQYPTVSDLLLWKNQPKLAAAAFGPNSSKRVALSHDGLILAQANFLAEEVSPAELLTSHDLVLPGKLLKLAHLLQLQKEAEARVLADELLKIFPRYSRQENLRYALEDYGEWPISLHEEFTRAIKWLYAAYPQRRKELKEYLPEPEKLFASDRPEKLLLPQSGQSIIAASERELQRLAQITPEDKFEAQEKHRQARRAALGRLLTVHTAHGNYRAAADLQFRLRELESPQERARDGLPSRQRTILLLHQATALPVYTVQPTELFAARRLLANLRARRTNLLPIQGQAWLMDDEVVARAVKFGPAIMPLVYEGLDLETLARQDRTAEVRIIAALGSKRDVPLLVAAFQHDGTSYQRQRFDEKRYTPEEIEREERTLKALHTALEKLTGEESDRHVTSDRLEYWLAWRDKHEEEILSGK